MTPIANTFAARWVRSLREARLDLLLIINERHLYRFMSEYVKFHKEARPHQGIDQHIPRPDEQRCEDGSIHCRDVLGSLLHDYYRQVA